MEGFRFLGFIVVGLTVVAGLDYYQQDKKTEGRMTLSGYAENINQRFNLYQDEKLVQQAQRARQDRWDAGPKPFFPESPSGWTRHALTDTDDKTVSNALALFVSLPKIAFDDAPAELTQMMDASNKRQMRALERTSRLYSKGDDLILLNISFKERSSRNTVAGLAMSGQLAFMESMKKKEGFAVVDGVAFVEETDDLLNDDKQQAYRKITGRVGFDQEVIISLRASAGDDSIRDILNVIDYAGLNALLALPASVVGKGIEVPLDQQPEIADEMIALYDEMKRKQTELGQKKIKNMEPSAIMVNALAGSAYSGDGVVDITGGKVFENQELMQLAYNRTQDMLLTSALQSVPSALKTPEIGLSYSLPDTNVEATEPAAAPAQPSANRTITVNKGGAGASSCAVIGNTKRCSIGDN